MKKDQELVAPSISCGTTEDDNPDGSVSKYITEESGEEPFEEETSEENVSLPNMYNESDCSGQSTAEVDEEETQEPSKQSDSQADEDTDNRTEQAAVVFSDDEEEEPFEEEEEEEEPIDDEEEAGKEPIENKDDEEEDKEPIDDEEEVEKEPIENEEEEEEEEEEEDVEEEPIEDEDEEEEEVEEEPIEDEEEEKEPTEDEEEEKEPTDYDDDDEEEVEEEEPFEEILDESINKLYSDDIYVKNEPSVKVVEPSSSNEKKRSLETKDDDSQLAKKDKTDQSLRLELDVRPADTTEKDLEISKASNTPPNACEQLRSDKRRRSRWEPQPQCDGQSGESDRTNKRRKTRWDANDSQLNMLGPLQLPDFVKKLVKTDLDPEIQELKKKLLTINNMLRGVDDHDLSGCPVYDDFGVRIDSKDTRFHEKLIHDRQIIIARLIQKNPTFHPPPDYKPPMLQKRIFIPVKEYPGYNFIGLIIGPRGNTQKKMEKETGARIMLRGVGSVRDEKRQQKPFDPYDKKDLHVFIEADNQKSLDHAVAMVEKLLIPVDEGMNEHKRIQLRELAALKGNLRDNSQINSCGEEGHMQYACPSKKSSILHSDTSCDTCGGRSHSTTNCPLTMSTPGNEQQNRNFLGDLGGAGGFTLTTTPIPSHVSWPGGNTGFGLSPSYGSNSQTGPFSTPTTDKQVDDANLLVRYLPQTVADDRLRELFTPFGSLIEAKVIKDRTTGSSKGYGFVKYDSAINAATALAYMNGFKIDGKTLAVKIAGKPDTPRQPFYLGHSMVPQQTPSPGSWPGPPGSILPESQHSLNEQKKFGPPHSSIFFGHSDNDASSGRFSASHHFPLSSPTSLLQFPGNPDYRKSQHMSHFAPPTNLSPHPHITPSLSSSSISPFSWPPMDSR